jgi:hypothetical protein
MMTNKALSSKQKIKEKTHEEKKREKKNSTLVHTGTVEHH